MLDQSRPKTIVRLLHSLKACSLNVNTRRVNKRLIFFSSQQVPSTFSHFLFFWVCPGSRPLQQTQWHFWGAVIKMSFEQWKMPQLYRTAVTHPWSLVLLGEKNAFYRACCLLILLVLSFQLAFNGFHFSILFITAENRAIITTDCHSFTQGTFVCDDSGWGSQI